MAKRTELVVGGFADVHRLKLATLLAVVFIVAFAGPARAQVHHLSVRSRTNLETEVDTDGRVVDLTGTLHDNLRQGAVDEPVSLFLTRLSDALGNGHNVDPLIERPNGPNAPNLIDIEIDPPTDIVRHLVTDELGQVYFSDILDDGRWQFQLVYPGGEFLEAASDAVQFDVAQLPIEITLTVPGAIPAWAPIPVTIEMTGPEGRAVKHRAVNVDVDGWPLQGAWVADHTGLIEDDIVVFGEGGWSSVEVSFVGGPTYREAVAQTDVLRYNDAWLTLRTRLEQDPDGHMLSVEGSLSSDFGPIVGAQLQISIRDQALAWRIPTAEEGHFRLRENIGELPTDRTYTVVATFDPHGGDDPEVLVTATRNFEIESGPLALISRWAAWLTPGLLLFGLAMAALVPALKRPRRKARSEVKRPGKLAPPGGVAFNPVPPGDKARRSTVSGVVLDSDTGEPIADALISLRKSGRLVGIEAADNGNFETNVLTAGSWKISVQAAGFVSVRFEATLPHRGKYSRVEIYLTSVRQWVRYLFRKLTAQLDLGQQNHGKWGFSTPQEVENLILEAVRELPAAKRRGGQQAFALALRRLRTDQSSISGHPSHGDWILRALTLLVEEVYYSGRAHDEDMVALCRRLLRGVRHMTDRVPPRTEVESLS